MALRKIENIEVVNSLPSPPDHFQERGKHLFERNNRYWGIVRRIR